MEKSTDLTIPEQTCLDKCLQMEAECRGLWIRAMEYSPRLAAYCPHWHDFTPSEWAALLVSNREFVSIAPLHLLGADEWFRILCRQPALIEHCPLIGSFPAGYSEELQRLYPWLDRKTVCAKRAKCDKSGSK